MKELREKTIPELQEMEKGLKEKRQDLRFQLSAGKLKNVREIRLMRKDIAQILTVIQEKQD